MLPVFLGGYRAALKKMLRDLKMLKAGLREIKSGFKLDLDKEVAAGTSVIM